MIRIYTDGSCLKNPNGPGGWAYLYMLNNVIQKGSGGVLSTSNNRMEIQAVIEGLKNIRKNIEKQVRFKIITDSKYVINCATGVFKRNKNLDLWTEYDKAANGLLFDFEWVKGHSGDVFNNKVDILARTEAHKFK